MKLATTLRQALLAGLALGFLPQAFAAGTTAGTTVSNTATVDYEVSGVDQPDETSNTRDFVVDRKIDLTVAEVGSATTEVAPGATEQITTFTVTNDSNSPLDFRLDFSQPGSDDFDVTNVNIYVDSNNNGVYDDGVDTEVYIDELAADDTITVFVVADIPSGQDDGDLADINLIAYAALDDDTDPDGAYTATPGVLAADAAETNVGVADDETFIDTVFGDAAGTDDAAEDGAHSDVDTFEVVTATIAVTKSSTVVSDPFNLTVNPKAIPGAVIEYCIDVENTGSADADSIVITDVVPANTTFVSGSIKSAATGTGSACDLGTGTTEDDDLAGDNAEGDAPTTGDFDETGANAVTVRTGTIAGGSRFKATFRVTVD